ncbi:MAG: NifU family protein [Candidatus Eremiobacteraeota bacterium]|nr:NifU family protein [Candidatus Eremiobacteraeota bacterium]
MGRRSEHGFANARAHEGVRVVITDVEHEATIEERVNAAIDKVRPGIHMDGGEVWLIKVENGTAFVQMLGACGGCSAANMTLKGAIEHIVRLDVPEIREVVQI